MTGKLQVTWFVPVQHRNFNDMPASIWIRCLQMIPYLEELGVSSRINDSERTADLCIFVRWQDKRAFSLAEKMKKKKVPIIFDLCTNYFDETALFHGLYGSPFERVQETSQFLDVSDAVTCASSFIAERARKYHPSVFVIPDSVDLRHFNKYKPLDEFVKKPLSAVWCGVSVKAHDLNPILPLLAQRKIPLTIVSDRRPDVAAPFEFVSWNYQNFPTDILRGEICVAPRKTDNPYDLGHSFFKIGVFLTEGVPTLASPIPSYKDLLGKNKCGKICHTVEDWSNALDWIIDHQYELREWSQNARQTMSYFSSDRLACEYLHLFSEVRDSKMKRSTRYKKSPILRRVEGNRLTYYSSTPDSGFWDSHWYSAPLDNYYELAEIGNLGLLEEPFTHYLPKGRKIVEAGCGTGRYVLALRKRGYDVEGIDWAPKTVQRILTYYPDLPVRAGDVTHMDVPDGFYSAYISLGVVEHRKDGPEPFLSEAHRVLDMGGVALISVPYFHPLRQMKARLKLYGENPKGLEFYQYAFSLEEYTRLIRSFGFSILDIFYYDAVKGLKDEIPWLNRLMLHPKFGKPTDKILRGFLRRFKILRRCSHMVLVVAQRN